MHLVATLALLVCAQAQWVTKPPAVLDEGTVEAEIRAHTFIYIVGMPHSGGFVLSKLLHIIWNEMITVLSFND